MKLTVNGFRISKNGSIISTIEKDAIKKDMFQGNIIKEDGTYYYFVRKQGNIFVYLP